MRSWLAKADPGLKGERARWGELETLSLGKLLRESKITLSLERERASEADTLADEVALS